MTVGNRTLNVPSHAELRASERIDIAALVRVRQRGARSIRVVVEEISRGGCRVQWPHAIKVDDRVWITLPGLQAIPALVVWAADFKFGCRFEVPLHTAVLNMVISKARLAADE